MKLRKSFKIEISQILLNIFVAGVASLLLLCIQITYTVSKEIEAKLLDQEASMAKDLIESKRINVNLINISDVLNQSSERLQVLIDSSDIFNNREWDLIEIRNGLIMSSKKKLQVMEDIVFVDAQVGDSGIYVNTLQINEALKKLLYTEYDIWVSFDNFLIQNDSINWKENEIRFQSINVNFHKWYEIGNYYNNLYIKALLVSEDVSLQQSYTEKKFDTTLKNLYFIHRLVIIVGVVALLILILLLYLILPITIKK